VCGDGRRGSYNRHRLTISRLWVTLLAGCCALRPGRLRRRALSGSSARPSRRSSRPRRSSWRPSRASEDCISSPWGGAACGGCHGARAGVETAVGGGESGRARTRTRGRGRTVDLSARRSRQHAGRSQFIPSSFFDRRLKQIRLDDRFPPSDASPSCRRYYRLARPLTLNF
jgi:hypothetical protein